STPNSTSLDSTSTPGVESSSVRRGGGAEVFLDDVVQRRLVGQRQHAGNYHSLYTVHLDDALVAAMRPLAGYFLPGGAGVGPALVRQNHRVGRSAEVFAALVDDEAKGGVRSGCPGVAGEERAPVEDERGELLTRHTAVNAQSPKVSEDHVAFREDEVALEP